MRCIPLNYKVFGFCILLQLVSYQSVKAEQILVSCPSSVKVNLDTQEKVPLGKTVDYILFSHPPGWDVNYEPGNTYQDKAFKTAQGKSLPGWLAGVKDLSSVTIHKMTILGLLDAKKDYFSRIVCQYRTDPNGGFRITLAKSMPTTYSCYSLGGPRAACVEKIKVYCPAKFMNATIPKGWKRGLTNKFTPSWNASTPLCQVMAMTADKEVNCKYCGPTQDSFLFIKQPFPENQTCESVAPNDFATCYYPGSKLDPL